MKKLTPIKNTVVILTLGLVTGLCANGFAQDLSSQSRSRTTSERAMEDAARRVEGQSERLDQDRTSDEGLPSESQLTLEQVEDEARRLTPAQIEELRRQLEQKNRAMIAQLDEIIARDPYNARRPDWMFQKAELLWELRNMEYLRERGEYNECLIASDRGHVEESSCSEPEPDYKEAQVIYEEILRQYADYSRLDEVIYRLGRGLIDAGKGAQAVGYLQRLVSNYPNSRYLPEAHLALGEFFFEQKMSGAARDNYLKVLQFERHQHYDYALYKLGWVYFNLGEFRESVDTFKAVVERTTQTVGFQNQAINDLVVAFAALPDGWKEARDYLTEQKGKEYTYNRLGQMAGLLEAQGKDDSAIEIYEWFIVERPNHARIPDWMESIIVAKKKVENFADLEETMNRYIAYLNPSGTWWAHNKENENATNNARLLGEASLAFLANHYHRLAQRQDLKDEYRIAANYYNEFLTTYPDSSSVFDMRFFLAEIYLYSLNEFEKAAEQYQAVVDMHKEELIPSSVKEEDAKEIVKDAAFAVVTSYNELVKANHEDSILVEMAEMEARDPGGRNRQMAAPSGDAAETPPIPKTDLLEYELKFVTASDQFAEMYPEEDITPTVDYVAAEVYKSRGHYDACIPRYENIITYAPKHRYASFAGSSLLEANYRLQRWDEVEKWARHLLEHKIFDVTPKDSLTNAIAFAINQRAIKMKDDEQFEEASAELLRLADEFPDSDLAPGALFNAAAIYEAGEEIAKAIDVYERLVKDYPKHEQAPEAIFVMGAIFEARADFETAAGYFERLGTSDYSDSPRAADAVYNAAVIRGAMQQWDKAISTYERYLKLFPDRDDVDEVVFLLPYLEIERKNWSAAQKRFTALSRQSSTTAEQHVEIQLQLGVLAEEIKGRNWERTADSHYTKTVELWKKLSEDEQARTRYYASEARFRQGEVVYEKFVAVNLAFPMERLTKALEEKGALEQEAESIFVEVIQMASPRWVAASAYRIGQMYQNFAEELYALPLPEGLTPDQEDMYRFELDDYAFPLQEKALTAFRTALKLALQYEAYNEWSSKSAEAISTLESEAFPITGQQGVASEHGRINFFVPDAVTSLDVVIERGAKRKDRRPQPEPPEDELTAGAGT